VGNNNPCQPTTLHPDQKKKRKKKKKRRVQEPDREEADGVKHDRVREDRMQEDKVEEGSVQENEVEEDQMQQEGVEKEGVEKEGVEKEGVEKEGVEKEGVEKDGVGKDGVGKDGVEQDGVEKEKQVPSVLGAASSYRASHPRQQTLQSSGHGGGAAHASMSAAGRMLETIQEALRQSRAFHREEALHRLDLTSILSSTTYRGMLRQTSGGEAYMMPGADRSSALTSLDDGSGDLPPGDARGLVTYVPSVTRTFEEAYMRQPRQGERECARGVYCECRFIDPTHPFTCVEFLTLQELTDPPEERQLCVICCRKETQFLFYDMTCNNTVYNTIIQRYGNLSGQHEYAAECLLRSTRASELACMPKPIMSHQRNRYLVVEDTLQGILRLQQVRVSPEDYHSHPGGYTSCVDHVLTNGEKPPRPVHF
jgi:hypothetical protein